MYTVQRAAPASIGGRYVRRGIADAPLTSETLVRPSGTNLPAKTTAAPLRWMSRVAQSSAWRVRARRDQRSNWRARPRRVSSWVSRSPATTPAQLAPRTPARCRCPPAASAPPVMMVVSAGSTGKRPSSRAITKMMRYAHPAAALRSHSSVT
jgi:hypothetical protein